MCSGNSIDDIRVKLGDGNDVLSMTNDTAERARVDFGPGDDEFFVQDTSIGVSKAQGKAGEDCLEDLGGNDFGEKSRVSGFELDSCDGSPTMSGRAVILDYDHGASYPANELLCLSDIESGGCTFTGPECTRGTTPLAHLHETITISGGGGTYADLVPDGCGHGEVIDDVLDCGPDMIPPCQ